MKKWQCRVCGYIHEGNEPPEKCPICDADATEFFLVNPKEEEDLSPIAIDSVPVAEKLSFGGRSFDILTDQIYKNHLHPITVHFPNGVLPAAVIFVVLSILLNHNCLQEAAYYNLILVTLTLPIVLFSGYVSWCKKYNKAMTKIFIIKITSAAICSSAAIILVIWRYNDPTIMDATSSTRWLFVLINIVMLAAAGLAGHLGGKLLFSNR
ncbi:MAG: rubredoxin-type Fe(Cys)4 protein [Desulfobulbaceae bacterium]|nr:rubredoxin-type Fe(Cys)4 protein [Desulfobulbaceae bacterium]